MRALVPVALAAWLAAGPAHAGERAPALVSWKRALCLYTACFLEPLVPDVRLEWADARRWVLSWPVHPWATPPFGEGGPVTLVASPFLEPQWRPATRDARLLAGARLYAFPGPLRVGALVEGAGLAGTDGHGGLVGAGLTFDLIERHAATQPWTVSLVVRQAWAGGAVRRDVALDVTVPLAMLLGASLD